MHRVLLFILLATLADCRHDWNEAEAFASSLRCGMTRDDVLRLAGKHGVEHPDRSIYEQDDGAVTVKPGELDFVDIWFQAGEAVAVQPGNYVAFTTGMEYGPICPLCGRDLPKSLRESARRSAKAAPAGSRSSPVE